MQTYGRTAAAAAWSGDTSRPNGTPRKLCDVSRLAALGWRANVGVREGIRIAYDDFLHGDVRK